jgi:CO/xanthine dehydrogenase Mo-binding subunit
MVRIDALPKVLGEKVFTRDLRAPDVKHLPDSGGEDWGEITWHASLLRASYLDRAFDHLDLEVLSRYRPTKCFVRRNGNLVNLLDPSESYALEFDYVLFGRGPKVPLFASEGQTAQYVGQPLALLVFDGVENALNAEREQLGLSGVIVYRADADDHVSALDVVDPITAALDTWLANGSTPPEDQLYGGQGVSVGKSHAPVYSTLAKSFQHGSVVTLRTSTPSVDPCFLEPDASLGRALAIGDGKVRLTLYAPTQSPVADEGAIDGALAGNVTGSQIDLRSRTLGGGFGGRDFSTFPIYGAIAALVGRGTPVRLALDRPDQFVSGIKRHASVFQTRIAHDEAGRLLAIDAKLVLDGGSQKDLTTSVRGLASHSAAGAYRYDHWEIRSLSLRNTGPLAGSMRGFGIPQVLFNTEQAIDQVAANLRRDPIDLRTDKVLRSGDVDVDEQILYHDVRNSEVLAAARAHALWTEREAWRAAAPEGTLRGVGFALAMEAFGTSSDGASVCVTLTDAGDLVLHIEIIELGQGATTGLAEVFRSILGARPESVEFGQVEPLLSPIKSKPKEEIYATAGTTSGSKSMFFHGHVLETLLRVWIRRVWLPEAASIWNRAPDSLDLDALRFDDKRSLSHPGLPPIPWNELHPRVLRAKKSRIWAHGSFQGVWSWCRFRENGSEVAEWLDAIALVSNQRWPRSTDLLQVLERVLPDDPRYGSDKAPRKTTRSVYASAGWLIAVEVDRATGGVRVVRATCILDAGDRASDSLVKGQVEGGFAQGIGFALMEGIPSGPLGGQRYMNFHSYALPRARHVPEVETVFIALPASEGVLHRIGEHDPAPPPKIRKKGIAEISITAVAPAIANGVFHALSGLPRGGSVATRPTQLPMIPSRIRACIEEAERD